MLVLRKVLRTYSIDDPQCPDDNLDGGIFSRITPYPRYVIVKGYENSLITLKEKLY